VSYALPSQHQNVEVCSTSRWLGSALPPAESLKSLDMSTPVSTSSPGPGWWQASDGKWYPQRWESTFTYSTHESLQAVIDEASRQTQAYGLEGWEIVGSSVQRVQVAHHFRDYDKGGDLLFEWSIVSTLKRPLPPG
jgi:hypothetical protein